MVYLKVMIADLRENDWAYMVRRKRRPRMLRECSGRKSSLSNRLVSVKKKRYSFS